MVVTLHTHGLAGLAAESAPDAGLLGGLTDAELNALRGMLLRSVHETGRLAVFAAGSDLWYAVHELQSELCGLHRAACAAWAVA